MKTRLPIAATLLVLITCATALAQSPATTAVTAQLKPSVHGHVVVPVLVHDKKGNLIPNLTAADFTLTDNTHPQTIQFFAPDTSLPLTLGIVAQTGPGMGAQLPAIHRTSEQFLTQLMSAAGSRVKAFVIQFNLDVDLLEDPSPSTAKLHQALTQLGVPQFAADTNGAYTATGFSQRKRKHRPSGAALYDAIDLASSQVLNTQSGRKALIVFSDGVDRGSKSTLNAAINAAQTAGVAVYAIYFKGEAPPEKFLHNPTPHSGPGYPGTYPGGYPGSYPGGGYPGSTQPAPPQPSRRVDGKRILAQICSSTGGEMFDSRRAGLKTLLAQIADQMNNAYILAYTRTASTDSGFHHIVLKPKQKDQYVQITKGYWLPQN
ncbi:MAG: VWA domain-containing protein [Acidobacteriaceae bacterium]